MPKLKILSGIDITKIFFEFDFEIVSQKGSHVKLRKTGNPILTVIVPSGRKEIPFGTFKSILRQANLIEADFTKK